MNMSPNAVHTQMQRFQIVPPREPLTDGIITLRLPSAEEGDIETIRQYSDDEAPDRNWLPLLQLASPTQTLDYWVAAWTGQRNHNWPTLVVTMSGEEEFVGIVRFRDRGRGCIEMTYGIAPLWRDQGLGTRVANLGAQWILAQPGVVEVELRIDENNRSSLRVAEKAGFTWAGTVSQDDPTTGETFEDLRFVLTQALARSNSCSLKH